MSLTNIEYGSLASSEVLNQNFTYLDNKISEVLESLNASVSSLTSNLSTLNTSFNALSEDLRDDLQSMSSDITEFKADTKILLNSNQMLPDWGGVISISISQNYTAPSNGYIIALPDAATRGNIIVNGASIVLKRRDIAADNASEIITIPVKLNDVIYSSCSFRNVYFIPVIAIV